MTTARDIVILAGGISHERDVSLRSGRRVADALLEHGHRVTLRDPDAQLLPWLAETRPDVVWSALLGANGENGSMSDLLDSLNLPYVGSPASGMRLAWDKPTAKSLIGRAGVRTPESITLPKDAFRELGAGNVLDLVIEKLGLPLAVKPAQGGSALGITLVDTTEELPRAMVEAYTYHDVVLIEQRIIGTEVTVAVLDSGDGPVTLPPVEIDSPNRFYNFETRVNLGETHFYTPARISAEAAARAAEGALIAHREFGLHQLSRTDFIIDAAGTPWFLESSINPSLTESAPYPLALEAAGHDLGWVYTTLVEQSISAAGTK